MRHQLGKYLAMLRAMGWYSKAVYRYRRGAVVALGATGLVLALGACASTDDKSDEAPGSVGQPGPAGSGGYGEQSPGSTGGAGVPGERSSTTSGASNANVRYGSSAGYSTSSSGGSRTATSSGTGTGAGYYGSASGGTYGGPTGGGTGGVGALGYGFGDDSPASTSDVAAAVEGDHVIARIAIDNTSNAALDDDGKPDLLLLAVTDSTTVQLGSKTEGFAIAEVQVPEATAEALVDRSAVLMLFDEDELGSAPRYELPGYRPFAGNLIDTCSVSGGAAGEGYPLSCDVGEVEGSPRLEPRR
jgi:hypothetical protein